MRLFFVLSSWVVFASVCLAEERRFQSMSPTSGPPSTSVSVVLRALSPGDSVDLFFDGVSVGGGRVNERGIFEAEFLVPQGSPPGDFFVTARGGSRPEIFRRVFRVRASWHQPGGDAWRTRQNRAEVLITPRTAPSLRRAWRVLLDRTLANECLLFHAQGLQVTSQRDGITVLDPQTGAGQWHLDVAETLIGSPVYSDIFQPGSHVGFNPQPDPPKHLVIPGVEGRLFSVDARSRSPRWETQLGNLVAAPLLLSDQGPAQISLFLGDVQGRTYGVGSRGKVAWTLRDSSPISWAPVAYGGPNAYGGPDTKVVSIGEGGLARSVDPESGGIQWSASLGSVDTSMAADTQNLYFGEAHSALIALSHGDGSVRWAYELGARMEFAPALILGRRGTPTRVVVAQSDARLTMIESSDPPSLLWSVPMAAPLVAAPFTTDELIVVLLADASVKVLDADDGAELWSTQLSGLPLSALIADGRLFCATTEGAITAYEF